MTVTPSRTKITVFDTTMRDGELKPGVQMNVYQKVELAKLLERMRVDVIEVGYPGAFKKDFDEIFMISKQVKDSTVCGLALASADEIINVALALKPATRGRIHVYTPVNLRNYSPIHEQQSLELIRDGLSLAKSYCPDVEWSAFDAVNSQPDFLCRAVETAIKSGATTVNIPDSFGTSSPESFSVLIDHVIQRVPNIDQAVLSVHCHNDLGLAVNNSVTALDHGVRQIECSVNGLGARQGNADIADIARAIANLPDYYTDINVDAISATSAFVTEITQTPAKTSPETFFSESRWQE